ncbi:MAG: D-alanyl-D-alanine carboxypeptidase/D-alanyl-D-alanine-endopeptidase [Bdellovibrionales bacterium]|jgi:D-alanyl-D-alanine carboxypeptidase/D-alanyl-D-alanine-endopeptidase (penicillin-binding protein 4)|nr:D-alanyl-D-alanine carboxypeptidase/D-alanyl-D-alanine-endopeptidase [Bdellovibrionales bacterium]
MTFFMTLVMTMSSAEAVNPPPDLGKKLEEQIRRAGFKAGEVGVWVSDGETMIYGLQPEKKFIPASLSKVPTAAAVLGLLPQGHKFKTTFAATSESGIAANGTVTGGVLKGSLYLVGGGDPSFVSESMWFLVNELTRTGVRTIEGDLIVDDSRFDTIRFGEDRQSRRVDRAYDAPLGAMSLNWNAVTAWVRPAVKSGEAAEVSLDVMTPFLKIQNQSKTVSGRSNTVWVERMATKDGAQGETFLVSGNVPQGRGEAAFYKSIREPDFWSGHAAIKFLAERGIVVKGTVKTGKVPAGAQTLATFESKPLAAIVADMMKWSNNYVADMLIKNISAESGDLPGTTGKGMVRAREYIEKKAGLKQGEYEFINGAGFTRENLFSPRQMGSILNSVRTDFRVFPEFLASLPIAGVDGTLRSRFRGMESRGWIRAKTGLLNGVIGLAGYAGDEKGRIYTFVFVFNGAAGKEDSARQLFDRLATTLVK